MTENEKAEIHVAPKFQTRNIEIKPSRKINVSETTTTDFGNVILGFRTTKMTREVSQQGLGLLFSR